MSRKKEDQFTGVILTYFIGCISLFICLLKNKENYR